MKGVLSFIKKHSFLWFILICLPFTIKFAKNNIPFSPYGDGGEYIMMVESFYNHFTPDLRLEDVQSYNQSNTNYIKHSYEKYEQFLKKDHSFFDNTQGFYQAKNGKFYCYHFWVYPLLNLPMKVLFEMTDSNTNYVFLYTNILFLFLFFIQLYFARSIPITHRIVYGLFATFSPVLWYVSWPHPEYFVCMALFSALIFILEKKFYWGLLLVSISAMHFPPLFIPALVIFITILIRDKFKFKTLIKLFFCSFWIIVPSLFYLYHFDIPNLIIEEGYIDKKHINFNRAFSFFFDANQGMILAIPFILIATIILLFKNVFEKRFSILWILALTIIPMGYFYLQMVNWCHGMSVVNRYTVWTAVFLIVYFVFEILRLKSNILKYSLLSLALFAQVYSLFSLKDFEKVEYTSLHHNKPAQFLLNNYPQYYNPDPSIMISKNRPVYLSSTSSVLVYSRKDSVITKFMIYAGEGEKQFLQRGVDSAKFFNFIKQKPVDQGWIYLNKNEFDEAGYSQKNDNLIYKIEKEKDLRVFNHLLHQFKTDESQRKMIEEKAKARNISFDSCARVNARYLIEREKQEYYGKK